MGCSISCHAEFRGIGYSRRDAVFRKVLGDGMALIMQGVCRAAQSLNYETSAQPSPFRAVMKEWLWPIRRFAVCENIVLDIRVRDIIEAIMDNGYVKEQYPTL